MSAPSQERSPRVWLRAWLASLRPWHKGLIAVGVLVFVLISVLLARFLSTENVERDEILAVLQAQAAGDAGRMIARLDGCAVQPACARTVKANAARLRRPGPVKIVLLNSRTAYSLSGATADTRVAWTVIGRLPVVQCVLVMRRGNLLSGMSVTLRSISAPIPGEADC